MDTKWTEKWLISPIVYGVAALGLSDLLNLRDRTAGVILAVVGLSLIRESVVGRRGVVVGQYQANETLSAIKGHLENLNQNADTLEARFFELIDEIRKLREEHRMRDRWMLSSTDVESVIDEIRKSREELTEELHKHRVIAVDVTLDILTELREWRDDLAADRASGQRPPQVG